VPLVDGTGFCVFGSNLHLSYMHFSTAAVRKKVADAIIKACVGVKEAEITPDKVISLRLFPFVRSF
jgi:hypothetical protein